MARRANSSPCACDCSPPGHEPRQSPQRGGVLSQPHLRGRRVIRPHPNPSHEAPQEFKASKDCSPIPECLGPEGTHAPAQPLNTRVFAWEVVPVNFDVAASHVCLWVPMRQPRTNPRACRDPAIVAIVPVSVKYNDQKTNLTKIISRSFGCYPQQNRQF